MVYSKLFVSFSSKNIDYAEAFVEALAQKVGREAIFFAPDDIQAGKHYFDWIQESLEACDALILLASAHSVGCTLSNIERSDHVLREIEKAVRDKIRIFPIDVDGVLKRSSFDKGSDYLISVFQYIDGQRQQGVNSFGHVIEPLIDALAHEQTQPKKSAEERLRSALQEGRTEDAAAIAQSLDMSDLSGDVAVLVIVAKLRSRESLDSMLLNDAKRVTKDIQEALQKGFSADGQGQALGLYVAGLMCKEYFKKRMIQSPLGSYSEIKKRAQQLPKPRLSFTNKKLVRDLSKDFQAFELDWFFGS